ncbi:binding-protein-dependent transport system inner membrane protein [Escherichia coli]|uniref:Binding-protein-dependent transport system inner membrane protein n=1 Tax=Escherichia coli TaxID=562 RepID=A0A376J4X8_ECOLX|nr:binding-protein-dependent transport system inner membrane protein [Escherichia coli]
MMDGLNRLQIIFRITVPLAMSGLISVFVYCFMVAWNDYLFASIFPLQRQQFHLTGGPERAVQYARLHLGTDDGGLHW